MINTVSFPGLGLEFTLNRAAFIIPVLNRPVYWYGIIIACGLTLAMYLCIRWAGRFGISGDNIIDMMLFAVPAALVSIRMYYVVFNLSLYKREDGSLDWAAILRYSDGGLAIYGAIISSVIVLLLFCRAKNLSFLAYADLGVHGLFIGQLIGRWGNFMNVEAFGSATTLPWRMCGPSIAVWMLEHGYVDRAGYDAILSGTLGVHPTFFYESVWNFAGLIIVCWMGRKRKFDGQCFLFYFFWYGMGRTWIEGLRTDSLYLFGWELLGVPIRVSQLFALLTCTIAGAALVWALWKYRDGKQELFVDRLAIRTAEDSEGSL